MAKAKRLPALKGLDDVMAGAPPATADEPAPTRARRTRAPSNDASPAPDPPHRDRSNVQLSVIVPRYVADQVEAAVSRGTTRRSIVLRALAKDGFDVDEADLGDRRKAAAHQRHIASEIAKLVARGASSEEIAEYARKVNAGAAE